ncbi:MAG: class I SAM-dependent methyltransferase [Chloroflexi bacterium]|nr:class I SAM-dependent methyltransferase [Chloroflexota bacterium]
MTSTRFDDRPPICDYEGSAYQSEFWEKGEREYEDGAEAIALKRLVPRRGELLLEVGAGAGRNTSRYAGFERIVLLDYSHTQLRQAQARLGWSGRYLFVAADVYRLPFVAGLFDAATMIRVIHHLAAAPSALAQIRAVLRPHATFVLEFANKQNLKAIGRWLLRRQAWNPFDVQPVEFAALNFDFHPALMRQWVRDADFTIRDQLAVSYFRLGLLKRLVPLGWLIGLDARAQWTGRLFQLSPSVFVRAQAPGGGKVAPPGKFFRCTACGCDDLKDTGGYLECAECGRRWAVRDGIYDFKEPL